MKPTATDCILIFLICCLLLVVSYSVYKMKTMETKCISNPISYGMQKASEIAKQNLSCYCAEGITINTSGIYIIKQYDYNDYFKVNSSLLR